MGKWLMPNPGGYQPYEITFENDSDLPLIVDIIRPLRLQMILQNVPVVRHTLLNAAHCGPKSKYTDKEGPFTEEEVDAIAKKLDMGRWQLVGTVYGPDPIREIYLKVIREKFLAIPGSRFFLPEDRAEDSPLRARVNLMQGVPTTEELRFLNGFLMAMADQADHVIGIPYRLDSPEERQRLRKLAHALIEETSAQGWGQFRSHTALMDPVAKAFGWNDGALMKLNETIKNALDPKGIMAPGKNGVWPAGYDKEEWVLDGRE
ncbi:hypothetical protein ACHAQH_007010 [Verticillium albo-atrum]